MPEKKITKKDPKGTPDKPEEKVVVKSAPEEIKTPIFAMAYSSGFLVTNESDITCWV